MCTHPIYVNIKNVAAYAYRGMCGYQSHHAVRVPCGKCAECLADRQNSLMIRAAREASHADTVHFLTWTYREDALPIAQTLVAIDKETGEIYKHAPELLERTDDPEYVTRLQELTAIPRGVRRTDKLLYSYGDWSPYTSAQLEAEFNIQISQGYEYRLIYAPSICARDPRLVIKNFRVRWSRYHRDEPIRDDFKYVLVGEYGHKNTMRPHYHMMTFNLSQEQAEMLNEMWSYGDAQLKVVNKYNKDGSSGYQIVARYLAKYVSKGSFDSPAATDGFVPKHRMCSSRGLGTSDIDSAVIDYYLARDVVEYNPLDFAGIQSLPEDKKSLLFNEIRKRNKYEMTILVTDKNTGLKKTITCGYKLPQALIRKIYGFKQKQGYASWSAIYYLVKDFLQSESSRRDAEEFKEFASQYDSKDYSMACALYEERKNLDLQTREENRAQKHREFYKQSQF